MMKALTNSTPCKPSKTSPTKHEVWPRFWGCPRLIILGGGSPKDAPDAKQDA
ncbi:hypothetical protein MON38_18955 [Hymenobacter sp. DH14]|uniref:Uncharacterized protein n=1 Tax=Hymenobacter cyanobacteriorum TaxID=2926463 RepID=A0A9X1VIK5_9BACT|nr:hypothetical protein [Hymenobacter cyanobacteriorum]MCI1189507.1 hypothetical protein [Hymenobacter cyanobacteriorum]